MYINKEIVSEVLTNLISEPEFYSHRDQLSLVNIPAELIVAVAKELRDNTATRFNQLIDVTAVDWLKNRAARFDVVYFLYSIDYKWRLRLKVPLAEKKPHVESVTSIWDSANWYEREAYDMYGIIFNNHPDLRRFYMPEDYVDPETDEPIYPLRKDFPLMGIPESMPLPPFPEKYGEIQ